MTADKKIEADALAALGIDKAPPKRPAAPQPPSPASPAGTPPDGRQADRIVAAVASSGEATQGELRRLFYVLLAGLLFYVAHAALAELRYRSARAELDKAAATLR